MKSSIYYKICFAFISAIIVYGFSLTNFTLMVDSESPIVPTFSLEHGRWGTNFIRYHLFGGHLPYFTQLLGIFFLGISAVLMTEIFKFKNLAPYAFILLFVSFPQHAYQLAFTMQADAIGIGYFTGSLAVYLWFIKLSHLQKKEFFTIKSIAYLFCVILLLTCTIGTYQGLIFVPIVLFAAKFFQLLFNNLDIKKEIRNAILFVGSMFSAAILYLLSIKMFFSDKQGSYLSSYAEGENENPYLRFLEIWEDNLLGLFYYGEQFFILTSICGLLTLGYLFYKRKYFILKILVLIFLFLAPFIVSFFIPGTYHPPRIYIGSTILFAFMIVFIINKIFNQRILMILSVIVFLGNTFMVTNLFNSAHQIYQFDLEMAKNIDKEIKSKLGGDTPERTYLYFHGSPPISNYQDMTLPDSEVFASGIFRWDNGSNQRMLNFFNYHHLGNYNVIDKEEIYDQIKDSIPRMPKWPNEGSIWKKDNIVVVKFSQTAGAPLNFQDSEELNSTRINKIEKLPEINENIVGNFDEIKDDPESLYIVGWAALKGLDSGNVMIELVADNQTDIYVISSASYPRQDISNWLADGHNYDSSGIIIEFEKKYLKKGNYSLGLLVTDLNNQKTHYKPFNQMMEVN
ncbi:hypothetical protein GO491_06275 [Flavobacteriaceae bacterium Ap0902]|nr:hypothetical protein [Flavobacteriaceae bacterium Ap0902]